MLRKLTLLVGIFIFGLIGLNNVMTIGAMAFAETSRDAPKIPRVITLEFVSDGTGRSLEIRSDHATLTEINERCLDKLWNPSHRDWREELRSNDGLRHWVGLLREHAKHGVTYWSDLPTGDSRPLKADEQIWDVAIEVVQEMKRDGAVVR